MDRQGLMEAASAGKLSGAYLLHGEDELLKQEALQAMRRALLPAGLEDLNETVLDNPTEQEVIAACETVPLMADKRLVVVRDFAVLTGRQSRAELLEEYVTHVPESCVLVFLCMGRANGTKKLTRQLNTHGTSVEFQHMREPELTNWVRGRFQQAGKLCSAPTASLLIFTSGTETAQLEGEIAKLVAYIGTRDGVTDDDVREVATRTTECTVFQMTDAVVAGQEARAFALMRDLLVTGSEPLSILAMLLRQYRLLQHVKVMQYEKRTTDQMMKTLEVKAPFIFQRYLSQAKSCSNAEVKQAVALLLDTEYRVKSGAISQNGALETAMLRLFALRHARRAG